MAWCQIMIFKQFYYQYTKIMDTTQTFTCVSNDAICKLFRIVTSLNKIQAWFFKSYNIIDLTSKLHLPSTYIEIYLLFALSKQFLQ
jgi:hypothetical protein